MKLSVVIPVYNEKKTIKKILDRVLVEKTPKEVIIIDDGSTDGTKEVIEKINDKRIIKIYHEKNKGKGAAVIVGIKAASGDVLIIQDADLEYNPKYYQLLLRPILDGKTKVVYGSRLMELKFKLLGTGATISPLHYLANRFLSLITNILYKSNLTDMETGYKLFSKEVYKKLKLTARRFEIEPEITTQVLIGGYNILEVPITTNPRSYREGKKIKARDALTALYTLLKYRLIK